MSYEAKPQIADAHPLSPPVEGAGLQRKCSCGNHTIGGASCDACKAKDQHNSQTLQRRGINRESVEAPSEVNEVLSAPGLPLDAAVRSGVERRMGHDFSRVRLHSDTLAADSASAVNALAFTVGSDVVFGAGQYAPATVAGSRLLAHELTHVVQQQGSHAPTLQRFPTGPSDDPSDFEADRRSQSAVGEIPFLNDQQSESLPYAQAKELAECMRIMNDSQACHEMVLGEKAPAASAEAKDKEPSSTKRAPLVVPVPSEGISIADLEAARAKAPTPEGPEKPPGPTPEGPEKPPEKTEKPRFEYGLKGGGKYGVGSTFKDPEAEQGGGGEVTFDVTKKGKFGGALTLGAMGLNKPSLVLEGKFEAKIPLWELMTLEEIRKKLRGVSFLKEVKLGVGFSSQFGDMDPQVFTNAIGEYTINVVSVVLENKKKTFEMEWGLSPFGKIEGRPGEPVGHQHGLEILPTLKAKPRIGKGQWYLFLELPVRVYGTFEGLHFQGSSISFTPFLGTGATF